MKVEFVAAADKKPLCQRVLLSQTDEKTCVYAEMKSLHSSKVQPQRSICLRHGRSCAVEGPIDLLTVGLPCHPFSFQRFKGGTTQRTGPAEGHDEYDLVMNDFPKLVEDLEPGASRTVFVM